jgi:hypothetical protein
MDGCSLDETDRTHSAGCRDLLGIRETEIRALMLLGSKPIILPNHAATLD